MFKNIIFIMTCCVVLFSCTPQTEKDVSLGPLPQEPDFSIEYVQDDSNKIVVNDLSNTHFIRLWDAEGATPRTSSRHSDTLSFAKAGTYNITLYISESGGNGTASKTKQVVITKDAPSPCTDPSAILSDRCGSGVKCWKFSTVAGAITVGPTPGSGEWFRSPANGLVPSQYDDRYCFNDGGSIYDYQNQGFTVNPFKGYVDEAYTPVPGTWSFSKGTGHEGKDQILLTHGQFIGTRDSYSVLDIVMITEDELIVRAPFADETGNNTNGGWFEFKLVAE